MKKTVLITGERGFIGKALTKRLDGVMNVIHIGAQRGRITSKDLDEFDFQDVQSVVHLAMKAHGKGTEASFQEDIDLVKKLAEKCKEASVEKLVFLSSLDLNMKCSTSLLRSSNLNQLKTKKICESIFTDYLKDESTRVCVIRSPLVYGEGVPANFLRMLDLSQTPWPLPIGSFNKKVSYIYIGNLVSYLHALLEKGGGGGLYYPSDGSDFSLAELVSTFREASGRNAGVFSIPCLALFLKNSIFRYRGTLAMHKILYGNYVNSSGEEFNWNPEVPVKDCVSKTLEWYLGRG